MIYQDTLSPSQPISTELNRRSFLLGSAVAGAAVAMPGLLLPRSARAAVPKRGGHFRIGVNNAQTSESLDPALITSYYMRLVSHSFRSYVTEIASDNTVIPELAENWESSPDATHWVFRLRKGVEFHNGRTLTSDDVIASLNYHRGEASTSPAKSLLFLVESIEKDGDNIVIFKLSSGYADFPYILTDDRFPILPSQEGKIDPLSQIGTGGYQVISHEPGVRSKFKRFENYWKPGRAHFDSVELIAINDASTLQSALLSDNVDAINTVSRLTVDLLARNSAIVIDDVPSGAHMTMAMNTQLNPFDRNDLRMALKYGIDREAIVRTILRGHGVVANDQPIGPMLPFWADLEQRKYDPDRAKYHLKKAGYDTISLSLSASDAPLPGAVDACLLFQTQISSSGIEIKVVNEPQDGYWTEVWTKKPFFVGGWAARPTPDIMFTSAYAPESDWNETKFNNTRFNSLLSQARSQTDTALRAEMYREMQEIVRDEGGAIIPFFQNYIYARRKNVMHDGTLSSDFPLDGHRAMERWWFA